MIEVGIVGATGLVGSVMIRILQERSFPASCIRAFASDRHGDRTLTVGNSTYPVEIINPSSIGQGSILLGATSSEIARTWVPDCVAHGALVVDNSSAYRLREDVPLVVPEVNPHAIRSHRGLISNPNCSTIQLVVALAPLCAVSPIRWLSVSTYQAVSGAGGDALRTLERELHRGSREGDEVFAGNILTEIGEPSDDGYCMEEKKLIQETHKILELEFPVYPACARVPVRIGHTEAVTVMFTEPVSADMALEAFTGAPGLRIFEKGVNPFAVEGTDYIAVSRIRNHPDDKHILQFWVTADNLRKGAALNAVQIAEILASR